MTADFMTLDVKNTFNLFYVDVLTLSVRTEYIYSVAFQATSPAPFKYLFNKYPYWIF
jgi:hypothetical protein